MQVAEQYFKKSNPAALAHWLVEGLHKSGAIENRNRAELFLFPRTTKVEREAILDALFT